MLLIIIKLMHAKILARVADDVTVEVSTRSRNKVMFKSEWVNRNKTEAGKTLQNLFYSFD